MKKLKRILLLLIILLIIGAIILEIPTIADWGDYESYDSSSSYDDWGSSSWDSSDWGSSSSYDDDWGSSSSSWDDDYHYSSSRSSGDLFRLGYLLGHSPGLFMVIVIIFIAIAVYIYKNKNNTDDFLKNHMAQNNMMRKPTVDIERNRQKNRDVLFGVNDSSIEDQIQKEDPMFNKAEFLAWASDMFVKLQYAWSDRNLENIRYFVTPELYEQTNNQIQRYVTNKQINKLERVSVNLSRLYSFEHQGDRDVLRIVLESKMIDYIVDENSGNLIRGDKAVNVVNPYILTFVRKTGVKTPEGGIKPVTMNCPNCGGATTILSSGKCPYCGSIITTRDNNWTLSEMKRYNPNA